MRPDIIPYSKEDAERFGRVLAMLNIPSISPALGVQLVALAVSVRKVKSDPHATPEIQELLEGFALRLEDIADVAIGMQAGVIEKLEQLVNGKKPT